MIFQAPILALLLVSALAALVSLWGAVFGVQVLRHWDVASGARTQIRWTAPPNWFRPCSVPSSSPRSRRFCCSVYNADRMAELFVGAMCAVGTLNVDRWGFPALISKSRCSCRGAVADPRPGRPDGARLPAHPGEIRSPPADRGAAGGGGRGVGLFPCWKPTSSLVLLKLFTPVNDGLAAEMTGSPRAALWLLAGAGWIVAATGGLSLATGRGQGWFALAGAVMFVVALAAIVSVISLYVYDHPNHHCPFCLLQREHGYYGYVLYLPLFAGTAFALGAGVTRMFHRVGSLSEGLPALTRRLVVVGLVAFGLFGVAVLWAIASSQLILFG
ncbi:MAG: hypothetical protein R3D80_14575 [Paracoccaceae bacterium]